MAKTYDFKTNYPNLVSQIEDAIAKNQIEDMRYSNEYLYRALNSQLARHAKFFAERDIKDPIELVLTMFDVPNGAARKQARRASKERVKKIYEQTLNRRLEQATTKEELRKIQIMKQYNGFDDDQNSPV